MRRGVQIGAVVLLSLALGWHWAVLQTAAWAGMFFERVQSQSVAMALEQTFDGEHPCPVCLLVREGRKASATDDATPTPARPVKLDLCVPLTPAATVEVSAAAPGEYPPASQPPARPRRPSVPPPRAA